MSSRASQEISGLLEWSFILLESRRWECSQSQKSIIYAIVKKLGPTIINMENIHLKPQISVLGISSPAGWLAGGSDVEIFRSICDDWCWSETMGDNDTANEESGLASTRSQPDDPRPATQTTGCRLPTLCRSCRGENLQNIFLTTLLPPGCLPAAGSQLFPRPRLD